MPLVQTSFAVQAIVSLHAVPFGAVGLVHCPLEGLHVPATWHGSSAVQVTELVPWQAPAWQLPPPKHGLPGLHVVPFGALENPVVDVPGAHTRHTLAGSTVPDATYVPAMKQPAVHAPPLQTSPAGQLAFVPFAEALNAVVDVAGWQVWQGFAGFTAPGA